MAVRFFNKNWGRGWAEPEVEPSRVARPAGAEGRGRELEEEEVSRGSYSGGGAGAGTRWAARASWRRKRATKRPSASEKSSWPLWSPRRALQGLELRAMAEATLAVAAAVAESGSAVGTTADASVR